MARKQQQINKNRLTPEQQRQKNEANIAAIKKGYRSLKVCIKGYYQWAGNLPKGKGRRTLSRAAPAILLLGVVSIASGESAEPKQVNNAITQVALEPIEKENKANPAEFGVPKAAVEHVTNEIEVSPVGSNVPTYPVTIVRTGLDFQYTYDGELKVYADKTIVEATWRSPCYSPAKLDSTKNDYTYTILSDSSTLKVENNFTDCFAGEKGVLNDSYPYEIDTDGTIRADAVESDGSIIVDDSIVITGGPAPIQADKTSQNTKQGSEPDKAVSELDTEQSEPEPQMEEAPIEKAFYPEPAKAVTYYSTCGDYRAVGRGNFTRNDPEYTAKLDHDGDGIACEL